MKADTFSIGFGREITGWTDRRGTRWKVGWLPLGGYVKFAGDMNPASSAERRWLLAAARSAPATFQAKPLWQRFIIVLAGPVTNFLFAIGSSRRSSPSSASRARQQSSVTVPAGQRGGKRRASGPATGSSSSTAARSTASRICSRYGRAAARRDSERSRSSAAAATIALHASRIARRSAARTGSATELRIGLLGVARAARGRCRAVPVGQLVPAATALHRSRSTAIDGRRRWARSITGRRSVKELGGPLKIAQIAGQQASLGRLPFV